jgi:hypothetical protein
MNSYQKYKIEKKIEQFRFAEAMLWLIKKELNDLIKKVLYTCMCIKLKIYIFVHILIYKTRLSACK